MKIFSWMQSKLNAKQVMKKGNTANNSIGGQAATSKEEFRDWPQSLLSIGTFGITTLRTDPEESHPQTPTPEQVQEEFISYLDTEEEEDEEEESDPAFENRQAHLQCSMLSRGKDILVDNKNSVVKKKSLTFLLRKIFTSRNRLNRVVRDSLPDPTFDKSRMEKMLRAILNKKIHPQTCTAKPTPNKYLLTKDISMDEDDDENEGSTWVKTDSEYIVLEI
ncbi:hypothetical protein HanIR_Chr10g0502471 [Helianthus annuus]|nr:hypothetical protein HanIR_Chr10g0502471 [Helianthus annuus]